MIIVWSMILKLMRYIMILFRVMKGKIKIENYNF